MRCRCTDIAKVTKDIERCSTAQKGLGKLAQADATLTGSAGRLSSALAGCATPKNLSSLTSKASQLDKTVASKRSSMDKSLASEVTRLKARLTTLRSEDKAYHATPPAGS